MKQWEKKTPVLWENALGYCLLKYKWVLDLSRLIIKGRFLTLSAQILQCRATYIAIGGYICRCQLFLGAQPPRYEFSRSLKPRLQATNSAERSLHASPQPQGCSGVGRHLLGPLHSRRLSGPCSPRAAPAMQMDMPCSCLSSHMQRGPKGSWDGTGRGSKHEHRKIACARDSLPLAIPPLAP